jgi:hypothetical protein
MRCDLRAPVHPLSCVHVLLQLYYQKKKGGQRRCKLYHLLQTVEFYKELFAGQLFSSNLTLELTGVLLCRSFRS